jgi:RNA polymerase sigma-70 factor (ECF subfamily)
VTDLNDPAQFDRAYRVYASQMLTAANRVRRNPAAAEDVVQDVFMHLWRNPTAYDASRGALGSYLTMMARSRALDRWRTRAARDAALERSKQEQRGDRAAAESAADRVLRREGEQRMLRALDTLPDDQREAVLLAFGRDLTAGEIATAAEVPLGTAKSRVRLGLQKARTKLEAA